MAETDDQQTKETAQEDKVTHDRHHRDLHVRLLDANQSNPLEP